MREQIPKNLSFFSNLVNLQKQLINTSQYQEFTMIIIQNGGGF